jgi:hypothetical protein
MGASFEWQVDAAELKSGYDMLSTANSHLLEDAAQQKGLFDTQQESYAKLQVGASDLTPGPPAIGSTPRPSPSCHKCSVPRRTRGLTAWLQRTSSWADE